MDLHSQSLPSPLAGEELNPHLMNKKLFDKLAESMEQMGEIVRGERAPSRGFHVDAIKAHDVCCKHSRIDQQQAGFT